MSPPDRLDGLSQIFFLHGEFDPRLFDGLYPARGTYEGIRALQRPPRAHDGPIREAAVVSWI